MGEDKALLPFGEFPTLTQYQFNRLGKIFKTVYISCKDKSKFEFDANFIEDVQTNAVFAPTAGFVAIFETIKENSFFALSVDAPFVGRQEINEIFKNDTPHADATIAKTEYGIQPMCGIYHRSLEGEFIQMLQNNNHKLGLLLKNANVSFVCFNDEKPFSNLNHPHEYEDALKLI